MFIDASAIIAILLAEDGAENLVTKIEAAKKPIHYSALTVFEAVSRLVGITACAQGLACPVPAILWEQSQADVDALLETIGAREMTISGSLHRMALDAARAFELSTGESFAYACAKSYRLPILTGGEALARTDIEIV
ncbi:PIN domain-containing protein [Siculibacillus lacustris]|uniref:PIN domain-containing protein n=1 Tax=Siculibacillus lacustris TaxID=1549641 RepID=A0A4V6MYY3_9HYPH|nr:type II toxin-antitoxin system VapC family toxin [Siculibacillus lacustris]TBW32692.1 PIN domain-containing protein [Siculibacillus lacustris]